MAKKAKKAVGKSKGKGKVKANGKKTNLVGTGRVSAKLAGVAYKEDKSK